MKAAVRYRYGSPASVHLAEVPTPEPEPGEVLVEVKAAGVDRGVLHLVEGTPYALRMVFGLRQPKRPVLGLDLAGTVVGVGSQVTGFAPGDEVLGIGRGSMAQFCVAPQSKLVHKPAALSFVEAAALPVSGLTALQAVETIAAAPGDRVLVLGASGGVGTFAVQIAAAAGAHVTGACSPAKADIVRELGAKEVVDYRDPLPGDFDAVLAVGGNQSVRQLRSLLAPKGRLLVVGGEGGGQILGIGRQLRAVALNPFVGQRLGMLVSKESGEDLQRLVATIESGALRAFVGVSYPLDQAAAALQDMAEGRIVGKAVLEVEPRVS